MPKNPVVSFADIEADLAHLERSLLKIESPHVRYWIAQLADLVAEGVIAVNIRTATLPTAFILKQRGELRARRTPRKLTGSSAASS